MKRRMWIRSIAIILASLVLFTSVSIDGSLTLADEVQVDNDEKELDDQAIDNDEECTTVSDNEPVLNSDDSEMDNDDVGENENIQDDMFFLGDIDDGKDDEELMVKEEISNTDIISEDHLSESIENDNNNKYIYMGSYWRYRVTLDALIKILNSIDVDKSGKATYKGHEFVKIDGDWWQKMPIKWRVLNSSGDQSFVISDEALFVDCYTEATVGVDQGGKARYSNSTIRNKLNGDFYNKRFTEQEKNWIISTLVDNSEGIGDEDTEEKIYLPSVNEIRSYLPNTEDRLARYRFEGGVTYGSLIDDNHVAYWTRTAQNFSYYLRPAYVSTSGEFTYGGRMYCSVYMGIRPVMNVKNDEELFSRKEAETDTFVFSKNTIEMTAGSSKTMTRYTDYVTLPLYKKPVLFWQSLRPAVATVDPDTGKITAVANGRAKC